MNVYKPGGQFSMLPHSNWIYLLTKSIGISYDLHQSYLKIDNHLNIVHLILFPKLNCKRWGFITAKNIHYSKSNLSSCFNANWLQLFLILMILLFKNMDYKNWTLISKISNLYVG